MTLLFCFGPKPKFCSFDLDLDQAEQFIKLYILRSLGYAWLGSFFARYFGKVSGGRGEVKSLCLCWVVGGGVRLYPIPNLTNNYGMETMTIVYVCTINSFYL